MTLIDYQNKYQILLDKLKVFVSDKKDMILNLGEPNKNLDKLKLIKPKFGSFIYPIPQSYIALMLLHDGISITDLDGYAVDDVQLKILSIEDSINDTKNLVHVPEGVFWENIEGTEKGNISTNHLVAFAADYNEGRFCFYTDDKDSEGELKVFYHHQDEPSSAKFIDSENWVDKEYAVPEADNFYEWFKKLVEKIVVK